MRVRVSALFTSLCSTLALTAPLALCLCLAAPAAAKAESPYVQGLELYRQGKYQDALKALRAALPKPPAPPAGPPTGLEQPRLGQPPLLPPPPLQEGPEAPHVHAVLGFT
ncbi:MAG TPA: hypothetical protein VN419_03635, partial [Humidesulfovibrio sp.]|nr:hypothetical protein [Humidesulfovibrio sp.]